MTNQTFPLLIVILGPTATGKTRFAAQLSLRLDGEIISADSRQVYQNMNIGTGKDYDDYMVEGRSIPYHLIDIVPPGVDYNVFQYQKDFMNAFDGIIKRGKVPVLCGGTGMYLDSVLSGYQLVEVPENQTLRSDLNLKPLDELQEMLKKYPQHNTTDLTDKTRLIRALEINLFKEENPDCIKELSKFESVIIGVSLSRDEIRYRITSRLQKRLETGMVDEIQSLLNSGISHEKLEYYGLEYKYISQYLQGKISYQSMFEQLNTAIHQFAKRQMTWFRRMEKRGANIHWIDGNIGFDEKYKVVSQLLKM